MKQVILISTLCLMVVSFLTGICIQKNADKKDLQAEPLTEWQILQMAIIKTESDFNSLAIGKTNDLGIYQITPIYVKEVNRILGKTIYYHSDAFNVEKSVEMFNIFQREKNPEQDVMKAIYLQNPKGDAVNYSERVLRNYMYLCNFETIRSQIVKAK